MTKSFTASVQAFADKTAAQMRDVMRESVEEVLSTIQTPKPTGRMPVKDGYLINSVASGLNGAFSPASEAEDKSGASSTANIALTIQGMDFGDVAQFAWTAAYAMRMEYGFNGEDALGRKYEQPGNFFVTTAAAEWQQIVEANVARVKS